MKKLGRPKEPGNHAYRKAVEKLNVKAKRILGQNTKKFLLGEASYLYKKYNGRCVYCGLPLQVRLQGAANSLNFIFYIPIEFTGKNDIDNIVIVCPTHAESFSPNKQFLEDIPDIDTVADIIECIIDTKLKMIEASKIKDPEFFLLQEKIKRLKRLLNLRIQEFALSMRYKSFRDWIPSKYEIIQEDHNSFGDLVEISVGADEDYMGEVKAKITNQLKQIATTKSYTIIRDTNET